jgi:hypothetical protein
MRDAPDETAMDLPVNPVSPRLTWTDWAVALFALAAIALHDAVHVSEGRYWDVFWICNVAAAVVGPGILLRSPALAAAALTWLVPGTAVWLLDTVLSGASILPTSYAVHLGGTAAAVYATRRSGVSPRGWAAALALLGACVLVSRAALPPAANVNAAYVVPRGWGFLGGSRVTFVASAITLALGACWLGRAVGRLAAGSAPGQP